MNIQLIQLTPETVEDISIDKISMAISDSVEIEEDDKIIVHLKLDVPQERCEEIANEFRNRFPELNSLVIATENEITLTVLKEYRLN